LSPAAVIHFVSFLHALVLVAWAGVVATEAVLKLYPFRRHQLHEHTIRCHYWIDLLVELPLVVAVIGTGIALATLCWPLTQVHLLKIACVLVPLGSNLACIGLVVQRKWNLDSGTRSATCGGSADASCVAPPSGFRLRR
jgi:hypothetical protein